MNSVELVPPPLPILPVPAAAVFLSPRAQRELGEASQSRGGVTREALVRRGRAMLVVVPSRGGVPRPRWSSADAWLGSRWARAGPDGLERAGALQLLDSLEEEAATRRGLGTAALRPAYCNRAAGTLRAHLGLAGPVGAWCAHAALSGR